ncbi:MAG: DMT family transporter [Ascidiaceihabitans sp.]|jgi:drug/metabolite transporter (DMT)-like permease|tara:strand:- start:195 stop:1037 length:843 start_codon:yes stop_codon:yes gene_type:complete
MLSLTLGMIAACAWGVHDFCIRFVSQRGGILPAIATVMVGGALFLLPISGAFGNWSAMTLQSFGLSVISGAVYLVGCISLYKAFGIGPVRVVAPIVGSYPILSIGWAALMGQPVLWDQWLAVGCVIMGVAIVGMLSDHSESDGSQRAAIGWSLVGAGGFAIAFAVGHLATQVGSELPVILVTRLTAATGAIILLALSSGAKIPERSAWPLLALMSLLDALALGIVIAAGNLHRPEFAAVAASTFGIITIILAWLFLKERMTGGQWFGVAVCFLGIGYLVL